MNYYLLYGDDVSKIKKTYEFQLVQINAEKHSLLLNLKNNEADRYQLKVNKSSAGNIFRIQLNHINNASEKTSTQLLAELKDAYSYLTRETNNMFLQRAVDYFIKRIPKSTTIKKASIDLGTNEMRLNQTFRKAYGFTAKTWIRKYKIYKSCFMLMDSDLHISDISKELGFSAPSNFTNIFQKEIGITPLVFRKNFK